MVEATIPTRSDVYLSRCMMHMFFFTNYKVVNAVTKTDNAMITAVLVQYQMKIGNR
jgi:hypothetical protein